MPELLLELLSEEIPARMQRRAIEDLKRLVADKLGAAGIPAESLSGYVTPRRLALVACGIPRRQPDWREERRGPRVGAPQQAIEGFLRSAGLSSLADCEIRDTGRGEFYYAVIETVGRDASQVLPTLVESVVAEFPWPKSMRFPAATFRWVRPLSSVLCLFDDAVVKIPLGEIPVGDKTRGHRFLAPGEITIRAAEDYVGRLAEACVVLDIDERRRRIEAALAEAAGAEGVTPASDPGLLEEVAGLAEYPVVLSGNIDEEFIRPPPEGLPPEVLATAMRTHQKYFSCRHPDGTPAPRFLFVANNRAKDGGKQIIEGNERVLRARLADARFFWDQDRKVRLQDHLEALKQRVYHDRLGTMFDKVERMANLVRHLDLTSIAGADANLAFVAALLSKADLSTGMVGEFPELQGIMGRYYALYPKTPHHREDARVADAIAEHYKPLGPNDACPTAPESVVVALADKIDTLVAFFAIGEKPTGSGDPYALRRAAVGLIRLVLENRLRMGLKQIFHGAWRDANIGGSDPSAELVEFIADRLKVHLREQGVRHDLIAAAFKPGGRQEDDLVRLMARVHALESFLATDDGANLLVAYRRAANIVRIEERKDGRSYGDRSPDFSPEMLKQPEERRLVETLAPIHGCVELSGEDFTAGMALLATLRRPVDEFFDKVTVNAQEPELRENRLRLLSAIRATMNRVADFSQIEG